MKHIKKINEPKISQITTHDYLIEMARINDKISFQYDVFVYGGDSYGSGRNEHGYPHFHFADKIKGGKFSFSVFIPSKIQWSQSKELYIYESSTGYLNWSGYKNEKKELIKWLDEKNFQLKTLTNLEFIRLQWNTLNIDNKNVSQIKNI